MFAKLGYSEEPINYYDENGKHVPIFCYDLEAEQLWRNDDYDENDDKHVSPTVWCTFTHYTWKFVIICDRRTDIRDVWRRACELMKEEKDDADYYVMYSRGDQINTTFATAGSIAKDYNWCEIDVIC